VTTPSAEIQHADVPVAACAPDRPTLASAALSNRSATASDRDEKPPAKTTDSAHARRAFSAALDASSPAFVGWMMGALLLMNSFFALAYLALGDGALRGNGILGSVSPPFRSASACSAAGTA
jgi:hypothetical protein